MKLNKNFVLRKVADFWVVLPLGEKTLEFSNMVNLNETGALLWQKLEQDADKTALVSALLEEYDVSEAQAAADVDCFLTKLADIGCLEK